MSGDWKPGTIAMIRDKSTSDRSEWQAVKDEKGWFGTDPDMGWVSDADVTSVRPLVVLDMEQRPYMDAGLDAWLRNLRSEGGNIARLWLADQIESQTRPPRIPEPSIYGVVEAGHPQKDGKRSNFVRIIDEGDRRHWIDETYEADLSEWDDLIDPVLVREGVQS